MKAGQIWTRFQAAQDDLDVALGSLDADAILLAAGELHGAATDLVAAGAADGDEAVSRALAGALKQIEACRLRVMFLADHGARRVSVLTASGSAGPRYRPDRAA